MTAACALLLVSSACGVENTDPEIPPSTPVVAITSLEHIPPIPTPSPTPKPEPRPVQTATAQEAQAPGGDLPRGRDAASIAARRGVLEPMVRAAFPESPDAAVAIVHCETGGRWEPWAVSRTGDHGLAQINARTWRSSWEGSWGLGPWDPNVYDPALNLRGARIIWEGAGGSWRPWVCRRVL